MWNQRLFSDPEFPKFTLSAARAIILPVATWSF